MKKTVFVAVEELPASADKLYEYIVPENLEDIAVQGAVCTVPFGKGDRRRIGFILKTNDFCDDSERTDLKQIIKKPFCFLMILLFHLYHISVIKPFVLGLMPQNWCYRQGIQKITV